MLLHVLAHVDADDGPLVVEEKLGQGPGQLGLADPGRAEEQERADGPVRIRQAGAAAPDGVGDGGHGFVLADDALVKVPSRRTSFSISPCNRRRHGHAGPAADHFGDVLFIDLSFKKRVGGLDLDNSWSPRHPLLDVGTRS